jgi:alkyl hydroperoxide reductase subunit D
MEHVQELAASIPDAAKDIRLNLGAVLGEGSLSAAQRASIGLAVALNARSPRLSEAFAAEASAHGAAWVEDAKAAAALMAMNNVFYRFRHMVGKEAYGALPARLRMQRLSQPATSKLDFELLSIAVSAANGCEACVRSHEASLVHLGASEQQVLDAVRIAAVVAAAAVALELEIAPSAAESP